MAGTLLKGVDTLYDWSFFADRLTAGRLPRIGGQTRTKDLLLSEDMARRMDIGVDSRVEMIFVDDTARCAATASRCRGSTPPAWR